MACGVVLLLASLVAAVVPRQFSGISLTFQLVFSFPPPAIPPLLWASTELSSVFVCSELSHVFSLPLMDAYVVRWPGKDVRRVD